MNNFKEKVIYQIYPKSFKDTTGNGVGDLQGIVEKIPYLKELGVDMIWLNPIFPSPQRDNGYDVSDYTAINPLFGTMSEFEDLVKKLKAEGIGVMLDMVFNHTSTEHEWFQKALAGDKKYQDYYILRPLQAEGSLPTNWESKFSGPAWERFGETDLYYLHLFDVTQADLNWRNPEVRAEMHNILNFWLDKGVEGFRFDVMNLIGKDEELIDALPGQIDKLLYTDRPIAHTFIREMNQAAFGQRENIVTVGEMSSTTIEQGQLYSNPERDELTMIFSFHHLKVDYQDGQKWTKMPYDFMALKNILNDWQVGMSDGNGWNALFWNNHDQPRALNRFGDTGQYREKSAKMLGATIHLMRGTPYIYQGEEIGMLNPDYASITDFVDVESHNAYAELVANGMSEDEALMMIQEKSRDNSRSPMQWDTSLHAGFTEGTPWLQLGKTFEEINVAADLASETSVFKFYQQLIQLRKHYAVISEGEYVPHLMEHERIFSYIRQTDAEELIVWNNFYDQVEEIIIPSEYVVAGEVLLSNEDEQPAIDNDRYLLKPFETLVLYRRK
ncbi:alpha,alpha-phosphotrehalase [Vagococcus zengguangii]|uniref:Alpha,alpha-phosphotrehalase n=1 Tax=Vagococcus zengguangii TaxID=2571750 RepID=A0A4D7CXW1_9ENTE|nr:alpha,alpha-phosphotrehalase [Vagococcus zengguangii]QCI87317.1 alpha,alpha-phosphotrehalase [Vagococcus zengguangii]TLG81614.1 alpha,alpha-phosphotrehalase [Vagococcus zengguangii]